MDGFNGNKSRLIFQLEHILVAGNCGLSRHHYPVFCAIPMSLKADFGAWVQLNKFNLEGPTLKTDTSPKAGKPQNETVAVPVQSI